MNVVMQNDRILVEVKQKSNMSEGGILLPNEEKKKSQFGVVIAVGPGRRSDFTGERLPLPIEPGHYVAFGQYVGADITLGDKRYTVLREDDIFLVTEAPQS